MIEIRKCTVAEVEQQPNFSELLGEYAKALVVKGAPPAKAKMELYYQLEKSGSFQAFGAFVYGQMIGFVTVLVTVLPHYGVAMAMTESYFVIESFRGGTNAGKLLLKAAEKYAKKRGSPCLLVSAPSQGDLAKVLPHWGYVETNRVFFRGLDNA